MPNASAMATACLTPSCGAAGLRCGKRLESLAVSSGDAAVVKERVAGWFRAADSG